MQMNNKRVVVAILGLFVLAYFLGSVLKTPMARADFFQDLWGSITKPFSGDTGNDNGEKAEEQKTVNQEKEVSLYKPALDYEQAVVAAVKKASPAVVSITVSKNVPIIENCPSDIFGDLPPQFRDFFGGGFGQITEPCERGTELREVGGGSGFLVSADGMIVTNKHVVADTKASYTVFTNDGKKYEATVLARDPAQDLAIIKIKANGLSTLELGDSDSVQLGQTSIAIGNALGEFRNTVSVGVISGLARTVVASGGGQSERISGVLQTDSAINPGNSGGPLLNLRGQVIGINTAVASDAQNIGFAIPINRAKKDITSVKLGGEIQSPYLGVRYLSVTPEYAKKNNLRVDYGALVRGNEDGPAVEANSPAAKAGVQAEDIILEINGKKLSEEIGLGDVIAELSVGSNVKLKINRAGKEISISATLAKRPN